MSELNPATAQALSVPSNRGIGTRKHADTVRVAIGTSSAQSVVIDTAEAMLYNESVETCYIVRGVNPTAVVNGGMPIPAKSPFYLQLDDEEKIAVISLTAGGYLNITRVP